MVVASAAGRVVSASRPGTGRRPGIGARASVRRDREPGQVPVQGGERDGAARAAAAAAVVDRHRTGRAVGPDGAGVRDAPDADHHDAAARRAARQRAAAVVARAGAAAAAERRPGSPKPGTALRRIRRCRGRCSRSVRPCLPCRRCRRHRRRSSRRCGGCPSVPPPPALPGAPRAVPPLIVSALVRIVGAGRDGRRRRGVVDPAGCSGDAFALGAVEVLRGVLDVVGVRAARVAGELPGAAAAEAEPVHADGGAAEVERRPRRRPRGCRRSSRSRPPRSGRKSAWPSCTGGRGRPGSGAGPGSSWRWRSCTC